MGQQIKEEERYYDSLIWLLIGLLHLLNNTLRNKPTKRQILYVFDTWLVQHERQLRSINKNQADKIVQIALHAVNEYNTGASNNWMTINMLAYDLDTELNQTLNSIRSRYVSAIPAGATLIGASVSALIPTDEDITALTQRCSNSISKFVQFNTSQAVSNVIASKLMEKGYTEYQAGNKQDDRVRELHKEQNDFKTWHSLTNPPSTGLPGTEPNCRCFYSKVR